LSPKQILRFWLEAARGGIALPVEGRSSNHFELAFTESEFLIDFGQAYGDSREIFPHTRIIMTPRSAKTLLRMLNELLQTYEATIGPVTERNV
jgi:hypothetical protein